MFPCQWRTIAPIVGRTAYQCMEHYEKLLDRAQGREVEENDPRKLRPGEIDPNPETKPARPDPIDMEEDEKETINEARARLANTRGKKAKRKAREKQLEEARRLAALQKKRELKSAGIDVVLRLPRKKKREMNYNADVPFLRTVPEGSFKPGPEETPSANKFKGAISLQFLENRTRDEEEEKFKKIDEKRMKNLKQKNLPEAIEKINKMNDPLNIIQRNKLVLPEPQVNDNQLEGISKLTSTGIIGNLGTGNTDSNATRVLMGEYTNRPGMTPMSTMRTPHLDDHVMKEAKLQISLRESQTPLIGGENAKADLENFINHRKTEQVARGNNINNFKTPAPLPTPGVMNQSFASREGSYNYPDSSGANSSNTKLTSKTPFRDEMNINTGEDSSNAWENSSVSMVSNTTSQKTSVKFLLSNLPKPSNKYEIDFTDNRENLIKEIEESQSKNKLTEDSEDRNQRLIEERKTRDQLEFLHQTHVVQRNLPRPYDINYNYKSYAEIRLSVDDQVDDETRELKLRAEEMIKNEMLKLVEYDSINHPVKGNRISTTKNMDIEMDMEQYSIEEKQSAGEIIKQEIKNLEELNKENKEFFNIESQAEFSALWEKTNQKEVFYIPDVQMYFHVDDIEKSKKFDSIKENYDVQLGLLNKEENISKKLEEKAKVLTTGYLKRLSGLCKKYDDTLMANEDLRIKKKIYSDLKEAEDLAIHRRKAYIEESIEKIKDKESSLQKMYKIYQERISELENI
jgi:pre-mRNA-splicing factor CDC5/CEF1